MIYIRKNLDRGKSQTNWLTSFHTFSFGSYYDPAFMGFGSLRVINEDTVQAGAGFGKHPHDNMEIISYLVAGSLEHQDSMGTGSIIKPGEIQIMTAGTGIKHSEFNHSKTELLHFLQIWIIPEEPSLNPRYQQKTIKKEQNKFILIGSRDTRDDAVTIHQDVNLYAAYLTQNHTLDYTFQDKRIGWIQLIKGKITINAQELSSGDGAAIQHENIHIQCTEDAEFLFFDLSNQA